MVRNVAPIMADLDDEDFYLLSGVEHGMRFGKWVNRAKLPEFSGLDSQEVDFRLDRCMDFELIERQTIQYVGYKLRFEGYDALALRAFSERETINAVGAPLGEGKESDVFEARADEPVAIKFHREGLTNFREVQRERDYTADHAHRSWIYTARKAAEREYQVLEDLTPGVSVPKPIDQNRHAIVMERMTGMQLARADLSDANPHSIYDRIVSELRETYAAGYVHTDISEYNIVVSNAGVTIFDWPQAVSLDHPNAEEFLDRDVSNLRSFFKRKYPREFAGFPDHSATIAEIYQ